MELITVDQKTCSQCGACAAECPAAIIDFRPKAFPRAAAGAEAKCLRCGHCVAVCPRGCLTHREMGIESCPSINPDLTISAEQGRQLLLSRRSIRKYQRKPVARELISSLIDVARYAPTGHNMQEVEWLVVDTRRDLDRIEEAGTEWLKWNIANQPKYATMLNMRDLLESQEKRRNGFLRGAPALVITQAAKDNRIALIDSTIALTFFDLAAKSNGLGCCWAGLVYAMAQNFPPLLEVLSLPPERAVYGCMMLGYSQYQYQRIPTRKEARITWRAEKKDEH